MYYVRVIKGTVDDLDVFSFIYPYRNSGDIILISASRQVLRAIREKPEGHPSGSLNYVLFPRRPSSLKMGRRHRALGKVTCISRPAAASSQGRAKNTKHF